MTNPTNPFGQNPFQNQNPFAGATANPFADPNPDIEDDVDISLNDNDGIELQNEGLSENNVVGGTGGGGIGGDVEEEDFDVRGLLTKYASGDKEFDKLVDKVVNTLVFRKTTLKPANKVKPEDIGDLKEYNKGKLTIRVTDLSVAFDPKPLVFSNAEDLYKAVDNTKKTFEKLAKLILNKVNAGDEGIKYIFAYNNNVLALTKKSVDKNKVWKIWQKHDNTFNIYIGDSITGNKSSDLESVDNNPKHIVVEASDMAKNIGIWGQPGSGKSVLLRGMLLSGIAKSSNMFNFLILEKEVDFINLFKFKPVKFNDAVGKMSIEKIYGLFIYLALEYRRRNILFKRMKVSNIRAYNKLVPDNEKLPVLVLVVDEYKELRDTLKKQSTKIDLDKNFGESLAGLLQVSRNTGIFAWLSTQKATDKEGIHGGVKKMLNSGIVGHTKEGTQFGALNYLERKICEILKHGDFFTFGEIGKNFLRCPYRDVDHVEAIKDRLPLKENWQEFTDEQTLREYSNQYIVEVIEKMSKELDIELFIINNDLFRRYQVDIGWVEGLRGLKKLAIILFLNLFLEWFDKAVDMILNTTNVPENFDLEKKLTALKNDPEYQPFSLLFDYLLYLYNLYYSDFISQNFNLKKHVKIVELGSEEEKEQLVNALTQKIFDMMVYKLKDIK